MRLLLGLQDLLPASLTEYSARALSPDSLCALTLDEASRDGISRASAVVDRLAAGSQRVHGINTGAGEPLPRDLVIRKKAVCPISWLTKAGCTPV